jgi:hypothetical protein
MSNVKIQFTKGGGDPAVDLLTEFALHEIPRR